MAYSVNTTPLLLECESDIENEETNIGNEASAIVRDRPFCKPLEPKDKYNVAYFIFYLLGIVTLLPWNFFVTADDYWLYKFRDINDNTTGLHRVARRTPLQASFTSYVSVAAAVPNVIFLVLNTAISQRTSLHKRVIGSLCVMLLLFLMTLVFVMIDTDKWQHQFFIITIVTVVLLSVCSAILSGSIYGIIGKFSSAYITATVGGQALGGIFAAITEIISLAIGVSSVHSALVYFIIGSITVFVSIICYIVLIKTVFFKFHLCEKAEISEFESELLRPRIVCYKTILSKVWIQGFSMFIVFCFTLSVYPGVTVLIESEGKGHGNKWNDVFFVPTIAYLLFSVGDYLGRIIAGKILKPRKCGILLILSLSRFIFIPLIMLCNAQPRHHWGVVFERDYQYILILFLCALTNGYLANIISVCTPRLVEQHEKEIASSIISVFLGIGLAVGSAVSLLLVKVL